MKKITIPYSSYISVLIATKDRPQHLKNCLKSILNNNFSNFEILVADQSQDITTKQIVNELNSNRIKYFKLNENGKTKALNILIKKSKSEYLAFTDDDCVVSVNWLREIYLSYKRFKNISGVFGNIYPYNPYKHSKRICPSTFYIKNITLHTNPETIHYLYIGLSNNMSIRKSVLKNIGFYKEWLGPGGRFGTAGGDDSELIFRILINNYILLTNPKVRVYHNRWLSATEESFLQTKYTLGDIAFSTFYLLTPFRKSAIMYIKQRIHDRMSLNKLFKSRSFSKFFIADSFFMILNIIAAFQGFIIGSFMSLKHISLLKNN
jgi:glycosyltransferase involved in cell wall biosynthesis